MTLRTVLFAISFLGGMTLLGMWLVTAVLQLAALAHFIRGIVG